MKTARSFRKLTAFALAVLILGMLRTAGYAAMPQPMDSGPQSDSSAKVTAGMPDRDDKADKFKKLLDDDGFIVKEGKLLLAPMPLECCKVTPPTFLTCLFFNQASPYMAAYLPLSPHRPDGTMEIDYLQYPEYPDLYAVWRLQPDEAVVFVGLTPPPVRYYGFQTYRFLTVDPIGGDPMTQRVRKWNNFGDQDNQLTIHTAGTPNGTKGDPFSSLTIRITAADRGIDARVREAARRAGYPPSIMNTEPMPQSLMRMGVDEAGDMYSYILRAAMPLGGPDGQKALEDYRTDAPVRIFRVTPKPPPPVYPQASPDPFPIPEFRIHGTGQTEFSLIPAVRELRTKILEKYGGADPKPQEFTSYQGWFYGLHHMDVNDDGLAPSTDSLYLRTGSLGTLGEDDFVIVYGTNHYKTGKTSYMNITMYGLTKQIAPDDVDDTQLEGSADDWLAGNPDADKLYVYMFARNCPADEEHCFEVPQGCCGDKDPTWDNWRDPGLGGIKSSEEVFVIWRNYLDPVAKTGADPAEVILDKAIMFSAD